MRIKIPGILEAGGVYNSKTSNAVINFRVMESFLKKENRILPSTTNFIYKPPTSLPFLSNPFFNLVTQEQANLVR